MVPLLLLALVASVNSYANHQCQCKEYNNCAQNVDMKLPVCVKECVKSHGKMPTAFQECLADLTEPMTEVVECTKEFVREGCTNNIYNVAEIRNFTIFLDNVGKKFGKLAKRLGISADFKEQGERDFNMCLARCFFIADNTCTEQLDCALNMPTELEMATNIGKCILRKDKKLFMEVAKCLETVTKPAEEDKKASDEFDAIDFRRVRKL